MFKEEIAKLKGEQIDIAFFPVDPRLKDNYHLGGEYFLQAIKPRIFIPMHFGSNPQAPREFAKRMKNCPSQIVVITRQGEEILL
jgi:L-ascorbate metabolism protein UlaG (beta-lactamase superfamily)